MRGVAARSGARRVRNKPNWLSATGRAPSAAHRALPKHEKVRAPELTRVARAQRKRGAPGPQRPRRSWRKPGAGSGCGERRVRRLNGSRSGARALKQLYVRSQQPNVQNASGVCAARHGAAQHRQTRRMSARTRGVSLLVRRPRQGADEQLTVFTPAPEERSVAHVRKRRRRLRRRKQCAPRAARRAPALPCTHMLKLGLKREVEGRTV